MLNPAGRLFLTAVFYLVIPLYSLKLSEHPQRCKMGDDDCLAHFCTYIVQHTDEFPDLNAPKLDPYVLPHPIMLDSTRFLSILSAKAHWSNMTIYGFQNAVVEKISGVRHNQPKWKLNLKVNVPKMKVAMNTGSLLKLFLMQIQTKGEAVAYIENVELMITARVNVVHRNCKDYIEISDISTSCEISNIEIDVKYQNDIPVLNNIIKRIVKANWRIFKDMIYSKLDVFITKIMKSLIKPLCAEIAIQDFFQCEKKK